MIKFFIYFLFIMVFIPNICLAALTEEATFNWNDQNVKIPAEDASYHETKFNWEKFKPKLSNPLLGFDEIKKKNATIEYNGVKYYSATGESSPFGGQWNKKDEKKLYNLKWNILGGITNVISSNNPEEGGLTDDITKMDTAGVGVQNLSVAVDFASGILSFLQGAADVTNLKIEMDKCGSENKIVIKMSGINLHTYVGKDTVLGGNTIADIKHMDNIIKKNYPQLDKNEHYKLVMHVSEEWLKDPYLYYVEFDKNLNGYISFINKNIVFEIRSLIKNKSYGYITQGKQRIDQESATNILDLMSKNGFIITGYNEADNETNMLRKLVGTYQGSYFATQGKTGLTLTVYEEKNQFKALFEFYNLPGKTNAASGKYYMNVSYDKVSDTYQFTGYQWIKQPFLYSFANLNGKLVKNVLSGIVSNLSPDYKFSLRRTT